MTTQDLREVKLLATNNPEILSEVVQLMVERGMFDELNQLAATDSRIRERIAILYAHKEQAL